MLRPRKGKFPARLGLMLAALGAVLIFGRFAHGRSMLLALALAAAGPWLLSVLFPRWALRALAWALALGEAAALLLSSLVWAWGASSPWAAAPEALADRSGIFGGKNILVLAPHGDDELNLAGGVIEEYLAAGSRVTIAFSTNGDAQVDADTRAREELAAAAALGLGADRVIFLGYDSGVAPGRPYLLEAEEPTLSLSGHSASHAVAGIAPWREGSPYTRAAFTADLESLLRSLRPDIVISCLYDREIDHRTLALCFEQAMGAALRETPDWSPVVLGAFAYAAAWHAPEDYQSGRLTASRDGGELAAYPRLLWSERLSLPVAGRSVSLLSSDLGSTAAALRCHVSQDAALRSGRLMNADKVFFPRRTDSLLRDAELTVSSGDGEALRDWVLSGAQRVFPLDADAPALWAPSAEDPERSAVFTFPQPVRVAALRLWDDPDPGRNTLLARVSFDTGESVELRPDPLGRESGGQLPEGLWCRSLTLTLPEGEGEGWGLCEFAVYAAPALRFPFLKLTDHEGNYLYDVLLPENGEASYTWTAHDLEPGPLDFRVSEGNGQVSAGEESFTVSVPEGKSCTVAVLDGEGRVLDSARFSTPTPRQRRVMERFDFLARCRPAAVLARCRELSHKLQIFFLGRLRWV